MSKTPISLRFSQEKVRSWRLRVARRSRYVCLDHLFCTVLRFLVAENTRSSYVHPQPEGVALSSQTLSSAQEFGEQDFESSLPARRKRVTLM